MNNFLSVYGIYNPPVARETRVKYMLNLLSGEKSQDIPHCMKPYIVGIAITPYKDISYQHLVWSS